MCKNGALEVDKSIFRAGKIGEQHGVLTNDVSIGLGKS
jgi:hypothetical protein